MGERIQFCNKFRFTGFQVRIDPNDSRKHLFMPREKSVAHRTNALPGAASSLLEGSDWEYELLSNKH